ncbi:hypothetical protein H2198_008510 [Neophaeococcomyces mojaviensis]|uniref:Uncharacterized protein n=1 Tax=Neophaeococcomyces mojaviensis TaxID=3383035 RepID=A0ACC2ZX68_9EURO|nr:hypothetical protein H2198_008510 [Knufia sp. JES_112]
MPVQSQTNEIITLKSSIYAGGAAAVLGSGLAAAHATLKGRSALVWGGVAGGQCFVLGTTFWLARSVVRSNLVQGRGQMFTDSSREDLISSGIGGSFAGLAGGALRGPRNMLPGAIVLGLIGLGGQAAYTGLAAIIESPRERRSILQVLSDSSWWPLKSISDEDYEHELMEKVIAIEAEIAIIDEKMLGLKQQSVGTAEKT